MISRWIFMRIKYPSPSTCEKEKVNYGRNSKMV